MKIRRRLGCFETNSSSIHSLCVPKDKPYKVPDYVNFYLKCYGWGPNVETSPGNYLYTWLACNDDKDRIEQLKNILYKHGAVSVTLESYTEKDKYDTFYIDHLEDAERWIEKIFKDEETLLRHLFTLGAVIYITNDNTPDDEIMANIGRARNDNNIEVAF